MIRWARNKICTVNFGVLLRVALYMFENHWPSRIRYLVFIKVTQTTIFQLFEILHFSVSRKDLWKVYMKIVSVTGNLQSELAAKFTRLPLNFPRFQRRLSRKLYRYHFSIFNKHHKPPIVILLESVTYIIIDCIIICRLRYLRLDMVTRIFFKCVRFFFCVPDWAFGKNLFSFSCILIKWSCVCTIVCLNKTCTKLEK